MYAVVETGGKQYRVEPGQKIRVELLDAAEGATVDLGPVFLVAREEGLALGMPSVDGAKVSAKVIAHGRGKKVYAFRYKNKTNQRRIRGHRQSYTELEILSIDC
ncbi:50S ribosomal protein L21 [Aminithiophilus ramosus]|uniref:Large ribosomal subunit protein bL21 n=2 Tax=Synergistales TaxID=649776 RepID=A0A9Q7ALA9_9BACT|nr:50S ribosomal protein L21 [Aminithiophilus ramosus]QTX33560.1 50S ribosomal protein L21 [Aminithiophilus ramosus]QVL37414.1 50S ribosomal protein L21 [Synergistota bacterium]